VWTARETTGPPSGLGRWATPPRARRPAPFVPEHTTLRREGSGTAMPASAVHRAHPSFLREEAGFFVAEHGLPARRGTAWRATHSVICAAFVLAACTDARDAAPREAGISVVDDAGRTVTLARPARRVISMIPAQTEVIAILAGVDAVIARTRWDEDPRLAHLPSIDNALTPSIEWLAARRPDLVVAWPDAQSRDVVHRLAEIGI